MHKNKVKRLVKPKLSNKAFLTDTNDIYNTLLITKQAEDQSVNIVKEFMNQILLVLNQFSSNKKNIESISTHQVNMSFNDLDKELKKIENKIGSKMMGIISNVVNKSYQQGSRTAQTNIDRIKNIKPTRTYLGAKDKRIIKTIINTDLSLIKTLTSSQVAKAKQIFVNGLNSGLGQKQITSQIQQTVGNTEYQARRIVRTETTRTANLGAKKRYETSGLKFWQWNTAQDERVCEVCGPLHGKVVEIGKPFNQFLNTSKAIKQNRGRTLIMPPAHPFCRCGVSPAFRKPPKKVIKKKTIKPVIQGFKKPEVSIVNNIMKVIPNEVKSKVKLLNGTYTIKKTDGPIVEDEEVKSLVAQTTLDTYREATGLYLIGDGRAFVSKRSGAKELTHEIGHSVYHEYLKNRIKTLNTWKQIHQIHLQTGDFITPRAAINDDEHFSDAFRFYITQPEILRRKYPEIYDFMLKNIFMGNEKDSIITLEDGFIISYPLGERYYYIKENNNYVLME